jgi:hypothetical protein
MTRTRSDTSAAGAAMAQKGESEKLIPGKFARVIRPQIKPARSIAQMGEQR